MRKEKSLFFRVKKQNFARVDGDLSLLCWLSILEDYAKRFSTGMSTVTIPFWVIEEDYGFTRNKVWRYNKRLEERGVIKVDHSKTKGVKFRFLAGHNGKQARWVKHIL